MKETKILLTGILTAAILFAGCGGNAASSASSAGTDDASSASAVSESTAASSSVSAASAGLETEAEAPIEDGTYLVSVDTHSDMFKTNDADHEQGILTVKDGKMSVHIRLVSENIVYLYQGKSEVAKTLDEDQLIQPQEETVEYSDGYDEVVYAFDVPVPALDQEFDVAIIGRHGNWYNHEVTVSNPSALEDGTDMNEVNAASGS